MRDAYDYVIVGAGSAGCVLAARLSEDPTVNVLLIESGPDDNNPLIAMPLGVGKLMGIGSSGKAAPRKSYISYYNISPGGNRKPEFWLKGHTVGGSSSINGMVYMRGVPSDYDQWEAQGCSGWNWQTIGRCYKEMEHHELGANTWRGNRGPLRISMSRLEEAGKATMAAVAEAGLPLVADVNDPAILPAGGVSPQPCTIWRGRRMSASRAFLKPARQRANLHIITETDVVGITFDDLTATGVHIRNAAGERTVNARRDVILSAGAIHSPKLLQLSGIGPARHLQNLGIPVRVDSPEVGQNLQEHRTIKVGYRLKRGGRNSQLRGLGLVKSALEYALAGRGALTSCIWEIAGLIKTTPTLAEPDCQLAVGFFSYDRGGVHKYPAMALYGYVLRPKSRGELAIASADPAQPPNITANFLADHSDRAKTVALYRFLRSLAQQPSLAPYIDVEDDPGPAAVSDDDLVDASFAQGACGMHISGTCRMGSDDAAVLDPDLRVRGVNGLRVVDTSIMPTLVSGNTNGAAMALAWHAAERIKATVRA